MPTVFLHYLNQSWLINATLYFNSIYWIALTINYLQISWLKIMKFWIIKASWHAIGFDSCAPCVLLSLKSWKILNSSLLHFAYLYEAGIPLRGKMAIIAPKQHLFWPKTGASDMAYNSGATLFPTTSTGLHQYHRFCMTCGVASIGSLYWTAHFLTQILLW